MARGTQCVCHRHEYVTSEENHHMQPQSRGGRTRADNMVYLCSNAHGDVHYFLDLIEDHRGPEHVPFALAKHFSPAVRRVARRGWAKYAEDFLAGKYDAHRLLWLSSGEPREGTTHGLPYAVAAQRSVADHLLGQARLHLMGHPGLAGPL